MGELIRFSEHGGSPPQGRRRSRDLGEGSARILPFLGVRYSRWADDPAPKRKRIRARSAGASTDLTD